jgi:hypothetical protein
MVAGSKSPKDYEISADALSVEPYGIMLRRDDAPFKKVVDETMIATYRSGAINAIYDKWFLKPIPPKGINLDVPMSAERRPARIAIRSAAARIARLMFLRLKRSRQCTSRGCVQLQSSRVVSSRPGLARKARRMPRTTKPGGVMAESRRHSPVSAACGEPR